LHDFYGAAFKTAYEAYEAKAARGEIKVFKKVRATDLWRRMLTMVFETGHPWVTFKDPCNIRSPQRHAGVVHSSNLCTEITLNTSNDEVAVCNLGSVNLAQHVTAEGLDHGRIARTVKTAMRMLDNVIDINFYTIPEARRSNLKHRPIGLGIMGFQDALQTLRVPYASEAAVRFADASMEAISFQAISASVDLAAERGRYPSFAGSLWSQGVLPIDSVELLAESRGSLALDRSAQLDWAGLRERVKTIGMRNSNTMAIAPTATISNICGVSQSIEPAYQNLFVKSNMSGDFTVVNAALVRDLKARGLWDKVMVSDLKYFDGAVQNIDRMPEDLKALYATAFEIDCAWLIEAAARRQKWIDQSQSLNLYLANPSGKRLDALYRLAWERGLKTTYYLRTRSATHVEKSTVKVTDGKLNAVSIAPAAAAPEPWGQVCSIDDPTCEACQ
jgi:ribonucleoside-diphosphate reductase alpha chain